MNIAEATKICQDFAVRHELIFKREGEAGFGRSCCGISTGSAWLDYNPQRALQHDHEINPHGFEPVAKFAKVDLSPPREVAHAYHKHECLAVLHHGDSDDNAVIELAIWIQDMEQKAAKAGSELFVETYDKGYKGMQALFQNLSGPVYAIGVR